MVGRGVSATRVAAVTLAVGMALAGVPPVAEADEPIDRGDWIIDPDQDDTVAPSVPTVVLSDPPPGALVDGAVRVAVEVSAAADVERVEFLLDGVVEATVLEEPLEWLLDTDGVDEGDHGLSARVVDALGQHAMAEPVAITVDRSARPRADLEADLAAGVVSPDDYTRYAVYRLFAPDLVPVGYRIGDEPVEEGHTLSFELLEALRFIDEVEPETREEIEAFLTPQPDPESAGQSFGGMSLGAADCSTSQVVVRLRLSCRYEGTHASVFFNVEDVGEEDRLNSALVAGPDGIPDYVNRVAFALDRAYETYRQMGYREPTQPVRAVITPLRGGFASPVGGVVFLETDANPAYVARHELFHQFQYAYLRPSALVDGFLGCGNSPGGWWLEATAEWAAYRAGLADAHTPIGDRSLRVGYASRLPDFLGRPERPLATFRSPFPHCTGFGLRNDLPQYGAFVFAGFLAERFGPDVIRRTWEEIESQGARHTVRAIRDVVAASGGDLGQLLPEFHDRNYRLAYASLDVPDWRLILSRFSRTAVQPGGPPSGPRPARDIVSLLMEETRQVRRDGLGPGGASYLDIRYPLHDAGRLVVTVTPHRHADGATGLARAWLVPFDRHPNRCGLDRVDIDLLTGSGTASLTVEDTGHQCTHVTLMLSHTDPLGGASGAVDVAITYERVEPALLLHDSQPDGWWRLGQSAGTVMWDSSRHGRHGTFTGAVEHGLPGALYTQSANKATGFDVGVRATVDADPAFDGPHASVEAWVRTLHPLTGWVLTQGGTAGPLRLRVSYGVMQATVRVDGTHHTVTGSTVVNEGRWHHVALTYDGVTLRLYVDGLLDAALAVGGGIDSRAGLPVAVAHATNSSGWELRGHLDEVAIYRRALSAEEIRSRVLHAGREAWSCGPGESVYAALVCASQPVGYWRLGDQPAGQAQVVAADRTLPPNDGAYHAAVRPAQRAALVGEPAASAVTSEGVRAVTVPYDEYGRFALTSGSVEVWLRSRHAGTQQVFTYGGTTGAVRLYVVGGLVQASVRTGEGTFTVSGSTVVNEGRWHHVALTYDGVTLRLYVDGQQDAAVPATGDLWLQPNAAMLLGGASNSSGMEFRGDLDEFAVYDHPLPAHAITQRVEMAGREAWTCDPGESVYAALVCSSQPVGYWRLGDQPAGEAQVVASDRTLPPNDGAYHAAVRPAQRAALVGEPAASAVTSEGVRTVTVPYDEYGRFALTLGSVEVWLRSRHAGTQQVFTYGGTTGAVRLYVVGGLVQASVRTGEGTFTVSGSTVVNEGRWHHVALAYDGATLRVYVDGQQDAAVPATGDLVLQPNAAMLLGGASNSSGMEFRGDLDEFAVYDHPLPAHAITQRVETAGTLEVECNAGGYGATVCADSPVGYWPLNGSGQTLTDVTSNTNHGTHGSAATPGVPGRYGEAVTFTTIGSHSEVDDEPYGHYANDRLSVEVWFRTEQSGLQYLVSRGGTYGQFTLALTPDSGAQGWLRVGGTVRSVASMPDLGITDGEWHHIALTYDGWTVRLYADGGEVAALFVPGTVDWSTAPIVLGRAPNTSGGRFQGELDEVALYAHALPAFRIAARGAGS